jgi:hypothetical protein
MSYAQKAPIGAGGFAKVSHSFLFLTPFFVNGFCGQRLCQLLR